MLKYLKESSNDYDISKIATELCEASKYLGVLEEKIRSYHFERILIPLLHSRSLVDEFALVRSI